MVEHLTLRTNICEVKTNFRGCSHVCWAKTNEADLSMTNEFYSFH